MLPTSLWVAGQGALLDLTPGQPLVEQEVERHTRLRDRGGPGSGTWPAARSLLLRVGYQRYLVNSSYWTVCWTRSSTATKTSPSALYFDFRFTLRSHD